MLHRGRAEMMEASQQHTSDRSYFCWIHRVLQKPQPHPNLAEGNGFATASKGSGSATNPDIWREREQAAVRFCLPRVSTRARVTLPRDERRGPPRPPRRKHGTAAEVRSRGRLPAPPVRANPGTEVNPAADALAAAVRIKGLAGAVVFALLSRIPQN